jgi:hypothetical protein
MVILFVLTLVICFSPIKALAQFAPLICIAGLIFYARIAPVWNLKRYAVVLIVFLAVALMHALIVREFSFINTLVFLLTSSAVLILFYDFRSTANARVLARLSRITLGFLLIEAIIGLAQGVQSAVQNQSFDLGSGDAVQGTVGLISTGDPLANNAIFAILVSSLLVFVIGTTQPEHLRRRSARLFFIALVWLLASVLHTVIFLASGVVLAWLARRLLQRRQHPSSGSLRISKRTLTLVTALALLALFLVSAFPTNIANAVPFFNLTLTIAEDSPSEKARATYNSIVLLPGNEPLQPLIGVGFGQYSSRAALMLSGEYLSVGLPLPPFVTRNSEDFILSVFREFLATRPDGGSTFHPFYSWLSLYGEAGILGFAIVVIVIVRAVARIGRSGEIMLRFLPFTTCALIFYVAGLGLQDNYWEFTQAIFPAFLCIALGYRYLTGPRRKPAPASMPNDHGG